MTASTTDTLVRMANDISNFFKVQSEDTAVAGTADHIRRFWDPRMRSKMAEHLTHGGAGLNAIALKACQSVCKAAEAADTFSSRIQGARPSAGRTGGT